METSGFESGHPLGAAEAYERFFVPAIGRPAAERLVEAAGLQAGERVLDVGCGTGIVARLALMEVGPGGSVLGIDVNPGLLEVARATVSEDASIDWRRAPAEDLPLDDDTFDVALCQMSLQFFQDRARAIGEIRRVLSPGGRALLSVPGPMNPLFQTLARALGDHLGPQAAGFVRMVFSLHETAEIEDLLRQAGFETIEIRRGELPLRLPGPGDFFDQYVASTPLAALWAAAEEPAREAARSETLEGWRPFETDGGLESEQPVTVAVAG